MNMVIYSLSLYGYSVLHGACIEKDGKGILIFARSNTGKTIASFSSLKHGFKIVAEDRIILNSNTVYGTPLMSSAFHKSFDLKFLKNTNSFINTCIKHPILGSLLSYILPKSIFYSDNHLRNLNEQGKISVKTKIIKVVILEKGMKKFYKIRPDEAWRKIIILNRAIKTHYHDILLGTFSYFNPNVNLNSIQETDEKILSRLVQNNETYLCSANSPLEYINHINSIIST